MVNRAANSLFHAHQSSLISLGSSIKPCSDEHLSCRHNGRMDNYKSMPLLEDIVLVFEDGMPVS
ncbi:hypothetical protein T11_5009 [Trichinella zimbabwensis]|uniref:Uncharacterized protein n=1 Tax=Trichinella zimbabwensis TaxID=268475 RepID=A0A0V1I448_9BILA|nr:hypothetical protein T11_5009 [Trichinella zimbabwensis]